MKIDLNADLGEGCDSDSALLQLVSSANIACGFHAGDAQTMLQSIRWAKEARVAIGSHPAFPDRENFGRSAMQLPPETVYAQMIYQIGALIEDEQQAIDQTLNMVQQGKVKSISREWVAVKAQTVCLHGDGAHALQFARRRLRDAFAAQQICVTSA
ncbi:hypothetical protein FD733_06145 [Pantoea sp. Eser]|nr:hypothetical protein [Pantoea sp. Eser]